jgi:hypothetical protein
MQAMARRPKKPVPTAPTLVQATRNDGGFSHDSAAVLLSLDDVTLRRIARDDARLRDLRAMGAATALVLPITARGRANGVVYFLTLDASARRYRHGDIRTAQDLVHRFASAFDRALRQRSLEEAVESLRVELAGATR